MIETLTNELELVARSTTEPSAFAAVYDHYLPRLYKYMRYRVSDINEAEELTSLTFEQVLTKISSYRPERGTFANWLFVIANNTFVDYLRAKKHRTHVSLESINEMACSVSGPEETAIHNESRKTLLLALSRLTDRERNLIVLKFSAGLTNSNISQITGLTQSNVAIILYRAMQRLRSELDCPAKLAAISTEGSFSPRRHSKPNNNLPNPGGNFLPRASKSDIASGQISSRGTLSRAIAK